MNKVILIGRLTKEPETRDGNDWKVSKYTLAVDRRVRRDNNDPNAQTADFISCVAFGKAAEFADNWLHKGTKIAVVGRLQTGKYTNKEGQTVHTTDVIVEEQEFAESKVQQDTTRQEQPKEPADGGFVDVPDDMGDLPFK